MHELIKKYFEENITPDEKRLLFTLIETDAALKREFISFQNRRALSSLGISAKDGEARALLKLNQFKLRQKGDA